VEIIVGGAEEGCKTVAFDDGLLDDVKVRLLWINVQFMTSAKGACTLM
jgi:hypothetical protein